MAKKLFVLRREDCENLTVLLDGVEIVHASYDSHGTAGMELLECAVMAIAEELGSKVVEEE